MTDAPSPQYSSGTEEVDGRRKRLAFTVDLIGRALEAGRASLSIYPLEKDAPPRAVEIIEQRRSLLNTACYEFKTTFHHDLAVVSGVAQQPPDLEALCHDYAQRWHGEDWPLMDDEAKAELRMEAHRWLKCCSAVSRPTEPAQAGPDPSLQKMQISTRNAVIEECARVADRWGDGEATMAAAEIRMLKTSPVSSTSRATTDRNLAESRCEDCPAPRCIVCPVTSTDGK